MPAPFVMRLWAFLVLRIHKIRVNTVRYSGLCDWMCDHHGKGLLVVANHIGYLDFIPLFYFYPEARVIASIHIRKYFLLGSLLDRCGVLWLDRSSTRSRASVRSEARRILEYGGTVGVAPEGTVSYTGRPFHPGMFEEAVKVGADIRGVRIDYDPAFLAQMVGTEFEKRIGFVTSQNPEMTLSFYPPMKAVGDPKDVCAYWQKTLVGL